tara:strand:+ start:215 stop:2695 length:2481 start_codon:yes stop_codon:yes gene_type:complete
MRLKQIKLSGFKSFVDPTSIAFPSSLTGVVGPNGCGKSNVIDAVRWVLGESSARNLRSDTMADVVFNGSSSRKPVSRASVELFFDNEDGRIGGEYSSYNEISVRRTVELDGQSNYFLNSASCRKRDITDVFLGTGLGPKSYAIIEQDMISRLVSSKPEEMRSYIEEVAGISKYLERKKETESRIKRTRENLDRLQDLRDEVDRILIKLKQQANAAEKYSILRKQENEARGILKAFQWKSIHEKVIQHEEEISLQQVKMEEVNTIKISSDAEIDTLRANNLELQTTMDKIQQSFYEAGSDISRNEQELSIQKQKNKELISEIESLKENLNLKNLETDELIKEREHLLSVLNEMTPQIEELSSSQNQESLIGSGSKDLLLEWDKLLLVLNTLISDFININQNFRDNLGSKLDEKNVQELQNKIEVISAELSGLKSEPSLLIEKTNNLLRESEEENKAQKEDLLYKTKEFADIQAKLASVNTNLHYIDADLKNISTKLELRKSESIDLLAPVNSLQENLDKKLEKRLSIEADLLKVRSEIEKNYESIRSLERTKAEQEQNTNYQREKLEDLRLELQAAKIEKENIEKNLIESELILKTLLELIDDNSTETSLRDNIDKIERGINRLGAINLAAVEESGIEEKRKLHLDEQNKELVTALETLEGAIQKIDKETKTTFKDTFDSLNISLSKFFPKLFGGGHAELVMLGEDLLSSGVGIIASPPGKKNASVSQLSGGEKALSAIALVFAFFELNPAPFCMLDEVDAPLDDLNTSRFIDLVVEMSEKVQFIYITHNKISMEKSDHLMGVTMQEPGVSRLVSVDVNEAVQMVTT